MRWRTCLRLGLGGVAALALALTLVVGVAPTPAQAIPNDCFSRTRTITPQGNVERTGNSMIVRDSSGVLAGYLTVTHSDYCQTAWSTWSPASPAFHGEVSIWNSQNQNQKAWTGTGGSSGRTEMVNDQVGVRTCTGMQVYYNGQYRRWQMGFCW